MKLSSFVVVPALVALGAVSAAFIHPNAPGAAHDLEDSAVELHDYMHDNYSTSYGAHGLETAATDLHDTLHDWSNGELTECDVIASRDGVDAAVQDVTTQFAQNGIFRDRGARRAYFGVVGDYFGVWWYTLFASC